VRVDLSEVIGFGEGGVRLNNSSQTLGVNLPEAGWLLAISSLISFNVTTVYLEYSAWAD
jgi:hypothetical protein